MVDWLEYANKLDPAALAFMERFSREYYDADNRLLKSPFALHRDRLEWDSDAPIPTRWRKWWGRQMEFWPEVAAQALNSVVGEEVARVKHLRRDCYQLQNLAFRDAYAFKGVTYMEDVDAEEWMTADEKPARATRAHVAQDHYGSGRRID
jgi:hypothetical protein